MTDRLIYAALVAVWMVYLIPMGIRRYREVSAHGSIKSFSSSMKALGRSPSASETAPGGTPPGKTVAARPARPQPAVAGVLDRPSARQAASRRRRTLLVLLGLVAVTGGLVVLTSLLWPAVLVPVALVVAFLVVSRIQVARLERAAWARATAAAAKTSAVTPAAAPIPFGGCDEDTVVISGPAAARLATALAEVPGTGASPAVVTHRRTVAPTTERQPAVARGAHPASEVAAQPAVAYAHSSQPAAPAGAHPAVAVAHGANPPHAPVSQPVAAVAIAEPKAHSVAEGALVAQRAEAQPVEVPATGSTPASDRVQPTASATWDLRPVTLPTYITKSRAQRTIRGVDRPGADSWSSGRNNGIRTVRDKAADKPVQQRRAVGG